MKKFFMEDKLSQIKSRTKLLIHVLKEGGNLFVKEFFTEFQPPDPDLLMELQKIADGNPAAAYILGRLYAGMNIASDIAVFPEIKLNKNENRESLAIKHLEQACLLGHENARIFLFEAYCKNQQGCIQPNFQKWFFLCKRLADKKNQAAALDYGALCAEEEKQGEYKNMNSQDALYYCLVATEGPNYTIAHRAMVKIGEFLTDNRSPWFYKPEKLLSVIARKAATTPFVALYFAFYSCPPENRPPLPEQLIPPGSLQKLILPRMRQVELTRQYLEIASKSHHLRIASLATLFNRHLNSSLGSSPRMTM